MSYEVKGKFALVTGAGSGMDYSLLFVPFPQPARPRELEAPYTLRY